MSEFYELYEKIEERKKFCQEMKELEEKIKEKEKEIQEIIKEEIKEYKKYILYIDINPINGHTYQSTIGELKKDIRIYVSDKPYEIIERLHQSFFIGEGSIISQRLSYVTEEDTKSEYSIEFRLQSRYR